MITVAEIRQQLRWRLEHIDGAPCADEKLDDVWMAIASATYYSLDDVPLEQPAWTRIMRDWRALLQKRYAEELELVGQLLEHWTAEARQRGSCPHMARVQAWETLKHAYALGDLPTADTPRPPDPLTPDPVPSGQRWCACQEGGNAPPVGAEATPSQARMDGPDRPSDAGRAASPSHGPELYHLWLIIDELQVGHRRYRHVRMPLCPKRETIPDYDFATLIDGWDPTDPRMYFPMGYIISDLCTPAEAEAIQAYFARHPEAGVTLHQERQTWPISPALASYGEIEDFWHNFYRDEGFDCPVPFYGFYLLDDQPSYVIKVQPGADGMRMYDVQLVTAEGRILDEELVASDGASDEASRETLREAMHDPAAMPREGTPQHALQRAVDRDVRRYVPALLQTLDAEARAEEP
jgi:hypothetical protein